MLNFVLILFNVCNIIIVISVVNSTVLFNVSNFNYTSRCTMPQKL